MRSRLLLAAAAGMTLTLQARAFDPSDLARLSNPSKQKNTYAPHRHKGGHKANARSSKRKGRK
jgi:hypothetical protein